MTLSNKDVIDENLKQKDEEEEKETILGFFKKYKVLVAYCIVILAYYFIKYVVLGG